MRIFNTSGPNIIAKHYTLPRLELIEKGKKRFTMTVISRFGLHAKRGKAPIFAY